MSYFKRVAPFVLTLLVGIGISPPRRHASFQTSCPLATSSKIQNTTRLTINLVPDADFTALAKRSDGVYGSLRLQALFDGDGKVKEVRPLSMLPFGVPESAVGHGEFADVTPAILDSRFVKELPYGLTNAAIEQIKRIRFTPKLVNGKNVSERAIVLAEFAFTESRWSHGCSSIRVTVMDDSGVLWQGNTWVDRNCGCRMI